MAKVMGDVIGQSRLQVERLFRRKTLRMANGRGLLFVDYPLFLNACAKSNPSPH
jgi:hypothetical protein